MKLGKENGLQRKKKLNSSKNVHISNDAIKELFDFKESKSFTVNSRFDGDLTERILIA